MNPVRLAGLFLAVMMLPLAGRAQEVKESTRDAEDSPYESMHVLARAMQLIRQDYVNDEKISYRDLTYSALRGMLAELDPHSAFMNPSDFKSMQEDTKSEFGGLGVTVTAKDGLLTLIGVAEGSPGFEAGLQPGDQIRKINGTTTDRLGISDAVDMLRGEPGEKVTLTISRPAANELKEFTIARAVIKVPSVVDAMILPTAGTGGRKIGYLRLTQFNEPTASELARALDGLQQKGMEALVLDLRFNPGGLLGSAVDVCAQFVPPNTKIVSTEGRTPSREYTTRAAKGAPRKVPLAILINGASASGSEIVAGALKDLRRAILVGETTFGKGSVQSVIALPDGSAMRFTTQKYYTPSRRPIHEHGVEPDIRCALTLEEEMRIYQARRRKEMPGLGREGSKVQDPQLDRAVDALTGVLLYTGRAKPAKEG